MLNQIKFFVEQLLSLLYFKQWVQLSVVIFNIKYNPHKKKHYRDAKKSAKVKKRGGANNSRVIHLSRIRLGYFLSIHALKMA